MDDSLLRSRPKSTLLPGPGSKGVKPPGPETAAGDAGAEAGPWDDYDPLPQPGSPYIAYARPGNKPEIVLHVMTKDGFSKGYAWSNFDSVDTAPGDGPGTGPVLVVRFAGLVPTELRISGSNLGKLHACIGRQRIAWIREQPSKRGFAAGVALGDKAETIASIAVNRWKPERVASEADSE
jgi:hypothetical protein